MVWPFRSAQDRVDGKAADWASRMRGPERERHRAAFERWYGASPAHAEAYHEALGGFEDAGILGQGELGRSRRLPEMQGRPVPLRYAFGAVAAAAVLALVFLVSAYIPSPYPGGESRPSRAVDIVRYAAAKTMRNVDLPDGSRMRMAPGTVALVAFTGDERRITLEQGQGRFSVAHESRPFRVAAGEAEVLALGTVFEVSLTADQIRVALIEGAVDVSYPIASKESGRKIRRLQPGEQILVGSSPEAVAATPAAGQPTRAPAPRDASTMLQFDNTPLAQAVAEANRHGRTQLSLADPAIGELQVTGAFRAGDNEGFAQGLAAAFRLHLERRSDGTLLLYGGSPPQGDPRR